ncbi:hypothetical protein EON65_12705 [archaeon]|nr:MAG: hypothetical protein EON65_12705 [archaeon]
MSRILPSLPSRSLDAFGLSLQDSLVPDLQDIFADQHKDEENRDVIFSVQKKISIANNQLLECVRNGDIDSFPTQLSDIRGMTQQVSYNLPILYCCFLITKHVFVTIVTRDHST